QLHELPARHFDVPAVNLNPDRLGAGVVDGVGRGGVLQAFGGVEVIDDLNVGRVPGVVFGRDHLEELFHHLPVLFAGELEPVAPDIHQVQILCFIQIGETLAVGQQVVGVVAGGFPGHEIVRD